MNKTIPSLILLCLSCLIAKADVPRPEHPRPDAFRENWLSLNGPWQFEIDHKGDGEARGLTSGKELASKIVVPFCPESRLSGLGLGNTEYFTHVWYRRTLELPETMKGKRILLHFGGVDYKTWVYVNGRLAGAHTGENAAFGFEITQLLKEGPNELVVRVFDDLRSGLQVGGKQAFNKSEGCVYTRTTGIWQPVWLEAVGSSFVESLSVVPDPDHSRVLIEAAVNGADADVKLTAEAFAACKPVGSDSITGTWRNQRLVLDLSEKKLWAPGSPFLYDLKLTLVRGGQTIDELKSYFGLRKVSIAGRRILINGQPVFQRLILDQGFYPDGVWTAPTDGALKHDIEMSMAAGYNGARLHQKVFEPRFLYWADKLGYLVWGEFPNWGYNCRPEGYAPYVTEWIEVLLRDRNHPAIIGWCPFNETGAGAGEIQQVIWNVTKAVDPTRPVLESSGYAHTLPHPEVRDTHDYDGNPVALRKRWADYFTAAGNGPSMPARYGSQSNALADCGVPFMISEIGGIGWATEGGWGYGAGPKNLDDFYTRYQGTLDALLDNPNLFGFCYTQLTDVEQEHNGLYYYDRRPKFDLQRICAITSRRAAYERGEPTAPQPAARPVVTWKVLVGAQQDGKLCTPWRYVTKTPQGDWTADRFDDKAWQSGLAPFGRDDHWPTKTPWITDDIYLRKTFEYDGAKLNAGAVVISYDEDTEVYVNGRKILGVQNFIGHYEIHVVTEALRKALREGTNTVAVHTHQTVGGQHIDLALLCE
ncbi:MAG: sugar-binding domain-containing protein [Thermoguttaceae bacterium]|jgi:beta-galactosidase/beta-glucuronidase